LTSRSDGCEDNTDYIKAVDSSLNQRCSNSAGTKLIGCLLSRVGHKDLYQFGTLPTWVGEGHGVAVKMITGSDNGSTQFSSDRYDPEPVFLKWLFAQKLTKERR